MNLGVVIVTYNRLDKLIKAVSCFDTQTEFPNCMIIVDNASTDGTNDYLQNWIKDQSKYKKIVITNPSNLGGSGGFKRGLEEGLSQKLDWIWVSDDDAFPEIDALSKVYYNIEHYDDKCSAICGSVINNGKFDLDHRRRIKKGFFNVTSYSVPETEYSKAYFEIDEFSYVGTIIKAQALIKYGLTRDEYFIYYDDTEHSLRLRQYGKIRCFPDIKIHHDVEHRSIEYSWRTYYSIRNKIDMYSSLFGTRYSTFFVIKQVCKNLLRRILNYNKSIIELYDVAIKDGKSGNLGKSKKYIPGWKL